MGRMYFKGRDGSSIFSSRDGRRMEITDALPSAAVTPAVAVPGKAEADFSTVGFPNTPYMGECIRFEKKANIPRASNSGSC